MADPYAIHRASKKTEHHGIIRNLLTDVRDAAVGLPTGIAKLIQHPVGATKDIAHATWHDWSPLFHGHPKEFWHEFVEHPLGPLLDVSALVTGGAGLAGRVASGLERAGFASGTSRVARLGRYSRGGMLELEHAGIRLPVKSLPRNPLSKKLSIEKHNILNELSPQLPPFFRVEARHDRALIRHVAGRHAALMTELATLMQGAKDLTGPDRVAWESGLARHLFEGMRTFAFRHDPAKAIPEGWRPMIDPVKTTLKDTLSNAEGRRNRLQATLDKQFGIKVSDKATAQQVRATFARKRKNLAGPKRIVLGKYLKEIDRIERAQTRIAKAEDNFFRQNQKVPFETRMQKLGKRYTMKQPRMGFEPLRQDGHILIVPTHTMEKLGLEGANATRAMKLLYHNPTSVWKIMVLGWRPAFFVNNAVGNNILLAMSNSPARFVRGYVDALRQVHPERKVASSLQEALDMMKNQHWTDEFFKDQLTNTLADSTLAKLGERLDVEGWKRIAKTGFFGITHNLADKLARKVQLNVEMRRLPQVKRLMKQGHRYDDAVRRVLIEDARKGGKLRMQISQRVMDVMGDYHSLTPLERRIRDVVPFYTWDRHLTRHVGKLVTEHPTKLAALAATGRQGTELTEKILGDIPNFLKGAIPLSILGLHIDHPSRVGILTTQGLNPYATLPDLTDSVHALFGKGQGSGESVGSQLNPVLSNLVEQVSGHDTLSDAPVKRYRFGIAEGVYHSAVDDLPQVKLLDRLLNGTPHPKSNNRTGKKTPFLFEKDVAQEGLGILGIPVKQLNKKRARALRKKEKRRG